jgi:hypothetical protein
MALGKYKQNEQVVVGDFNLYHEHWFGSLPLPVHGSRKKAQVEALINIMRDHELELTLPNGIVIRPRADIRSQLVGIVLDLSWCSEDLVKRISTC